MQEKQGRLAMPQTIFVANDWPTGLLPLQLLAWQQKQSATLGYRANQVQQAASRLQSLVPEGTDSTHAVTGSSRLHSEAAVPEQLAVFQRLKQHPEASPDNPVWQDAHCTLQEMLQESLAAAKVRSSEIHCMLLSGLRKQSSSRSTPL